MIESQIVLRLRLVVYGTGQRHNQRHEAKEEGKEE